MGIKLMIPAHISGFWYVLESRDPLLTGSYGAGLIIEPGLYIEEADKECKVYYNDSLKDIKVYRDGHIEAKLPCKGIKVSSPYNIGEGYGASAGITVGGLFFAQLREKKHMTWIEIGKYAHIAEVKNVTGYGDVIPEIFGGGLELRVKPGAPGVGVIDRIPVSKKIRVITLSLEKYSTTEMFKKYGEAITCAGKVAYEKFIEEPTLERFGEVSHRFSLDTGMMNREIDERVKNIISNEIRKGIVIDFFIKKGLLVVISEETGHEDVAERLKLLGNPIVHTLNFSGCRLI